MLEPLSLSSLDLVSSRSLSNVCYEHELPVWKSSENSSPYSLNELFIGVSRLKTAV